jgi:CRP-like cAMP-binding protein
METLERILAEHPFFEGIDSRHLQVVVGCASNVRFDPGQKICREGEEAEQFFLIRHGRVDIEIRGPECGPTTIHTLGPGDILGWSWLLPPYRWHFDARAAELTRAFALDGKCLRGKCEEDHHLGYELLKRFAQVIVQRLDATRLQLLDIYRSRS